MQRSLAFILALVAIGSIAYAIPESQSPLSAFSPAVTNGAQRACLYPSGGWAIVNCSNSAAASSSALNQFSRYVAQCGDDSYFATGTAATGQDADSSDGWIPSGAWLEFMTSDAVIYFSCLNKNADSDCRLLECK